MFSIGNTQIDDDIAYERFACNLPQCKGACCTLYGGRGAPLRDDEVSELQSAYPFVRQYLNKQHIQVIESFGIVEEYQGKYSTVCVENKACVFVCYEYDVACCSLEKAFIAGVISWQKPLSCHLYPIRIVNESSERIKYERITECHPAKQFGILNNIKLFDFVKDALIRKYGEEWYDKFRDICLYYSGKSIQL